MENSTTIGILTESHLISKGLQYVLSKSRKLSVANVAELNSDIEEYIKFNHINLLIVSDSVLQNKDILKLYKTSKNLQFGIVRTQHLPTNPMFEFIIDFEINETEEIVNTKVNELITKLCPQDQVTVENSELSKREVEILRMVALGHTNQVIAELLFISIHTVVTHRKKITAKLGIKTISGLTVYALLNNIIESSEMEELN